MKDALKRCAEEKNFPAGRKPVMNVFVSGLNHFGDLVCLKSALDEAEIAYQWMDGPVFQMDEPDWPARLYIALEKMDLVIDVLKSFELYIYNAAESQDKVVADNTFESG